MGLHVSADNLIACMLTPVFFSVDLLPLDEGGGGTEDSVLTLGKTGLLHVKATLSCRFEKKHKLSDIISSQHGCAGLHTDFICRNMTHRSARSPV